MTFRSFYFLCLLLVTVNLCRGDDENSEDRSASTRIVGGTLAVAGEYPAQWNQSLVVMITFYNLFVHPYYNSDTMVNDVAVIRVSPPFTFNTAFYSATRTQSRPPSNYNCSVAGWGTTSTNGAASSSLRRVNVMTIDHSRCNRAYGNIHPTGMICAGTVEGGKDSCQGDSGGGLYCGNYVVGIVSFGAVCGDARYPGVYTSIAAYNDWIDSTLVWNGGSQSNIPTPRPGGASSIFVPLYTVAFSVYFVLVLR
ncbi:hypothetical protein HA402_006643 [Bradysia odoriphaga]|nr:hypothetical protein HA402_006643 [Bradysia odoriphaga]